MKRKKLLSMLTAGALAVTMVMPVMAADGGEVDVDVTTKTGILRVEVPTTLAVAVDQFETTNAGTQIHSTEFTIVNKSEVNVKVNVTSTATVKDGVALAAKRADVATATAAGGTAWLAVAAKKDATHYEGTSNADNFANLNESAANVTTFTKSGTAVTAAQTFYLEKASGTVSYAMLKPSDDGKASVSYAQFYELTEETFTNSNEQDELDALLEAGDVYSITTTSIADKAAVTKTDKGGTLSYASGTTYYTIASEATPVASVDKTKVYAYATLGTEGATNPKAAFRYIGELSRNKELWDATDISKIKIAYTIQGLPQSTYDAADSDGITYGLYKEKLPMVYSVVSGAYWISLDGKVGFAAAPTSLKIDNVEKTAGTDYTFEKTGWIKLKEAPAANKEIVLVVNGTTYKTTTPTS